MNNMCVWIDVLPQLVQIRFIDITSFVIPKLSLHRLLSAYHGAYLCIHSKCNYITELPSTFLIQASNRENTRE